MTAYAHKEVGDKLFIVGVGGVNSRTAAQRIRAGATLLQEVTNIRAEGTAAAGKTNKAIVAEIERTGVDHYTDLVGVDVDRILANAPRK